MTPELKRAMQEAQEWFDLCMDAAKLGETVSFSRRVKYLESELVEIKRWMDIEKGRG